MKIFEDYFGRNWIRFCFFFFLNLWVASDSLNRWPKKNENIGISGRRSDSGSKPISLLKRAFWGTVCRNIAYNKINP